MIPAGRVKLPQSLFPVKVFLILFDPSSFIPKLRSGNSQSPSLRFPFLFLRAQAAGMNSYPSIEENEKFPRFLLSSFLIDTFFIILITLQNIHSISWSVLFTFAGERFATVIEGHRK